jgi:hypothetical protein
MRRKLKVGNFGQPLLSPRRHCYDLHCPGHLVMTTRTFYLAAIRGRPRACISASDPAFVKTGLAEKRHFENEITALTYVPR